MKPRGNLDIPKDADIVFVEPAIVVRTTCQTALYLSPPTHAKKDYIIDKEDSDDQQTALCLKDPSTNNNNRLFKHKLLVAETLKKNQTILVRLLEPHNTSKYPYAYEACTFASKDDKNLSANLPEAGREIAILKRGFIYKNDIAITNESYRAIDGDIFPEDANNNLADIRQTVFADCFLLATIGAILGTDKGIFFFNEAMQQDNYDTVVRLYHPKTKEPTYVKVTNRYFCEGDDNTVKHRAPWIHILEKAYAGFGYKKANNKVSFHHPSFRAIYGEGGQSELAFTILTGKKAECFNIQSCHGENHHPWSKTHYDAAFIFELLLESNDNDAIDKANTLYGDYFSQLPKRIQACFGNDCDNFKIWVRFLHTLKNKQPDQYQELSDMIEKFDTQLLKSNCQQAEEIINRLDDLKLEPDISANFIKYITNPSIDKKSNFLCYAYPGKVENACYSHRQIAIYHHLEELLTKNHLITVSTLAKFDKPVPGLRDQHAYTLLDVKCRKLDDRKHLFIKLKNPWGRIGRVYQWDKMHTPDFISEDHAHAEFWLELNDFTRYCREYTVCEPVAQLKPQLLSNMNR